MPNDVFNSLHCEMCGVTSDPATRSTRCCHIGVCDGSRRAEWNNTETGSSVVIACCRGEATGKLLARLGVLRARVVQLS
jgi:hypothetical protein